MFAIMDLGHGSQAEHRLDSSAVLFDKHCSDKPSVELVTRISDTARTSLGTWYSVRVTRLLLLVLFHSHISKPI
jgi:hypothetical protein